MFKQNKGTMSIMFWKKKAGQQPMVKEQNSVAVDNPLFRQQQQEANYKLAITLEEGLRWWKREKRQQTIITLIMFGVMILIFLIPVGYMIYTGNFKTIILGDRLVNTYYNCSSIEGEVQYSFIAEVEKFKNSYPNGTCMIYNKKNFEEKE